VAFSVALFPYLKTSAPVQIGSYRFRSTVDMEDLPDDQLAAVGELSNMLFAKDDLQIASASYAIIDRLPQMIASHEIESLIRLRAVICYLYSQPHEVFDSVFLTPEECSLHVLSPARVHASLVRPEHHTVPLRRSRRSAPDRFHTVEGYEGLFNLSRAFWVEPGSRIYPPVPQITLNISQDLSADLLHAGPAARSLLNLLNDPQSSLAQRIFTAIIWYNFANEQLAGPDRALLNLAVAFEALLFLHEDAKTERFVDAVALLLGRTERIDTWAQQFYRARSRVAHEGRARDVYLYPNELSSKRGSLDGRAASLMFYRRQIFQLCLSTILTGGDLARKADLKEKFVTHGERLTSVCAIANDGSVPFDEKIARLGPHIAALKRYQFLESGQVSISSMIGAVRAVSSTFTDVEVPQLVRSAIASCAAPKAQQTDLEQLEKIKLLYEQFRDLSQVDIPADIRLLQELVEFVWMSSFPNYFKLLDEQRQNVGPTS
jgi:hypothetical protein